MFLKTPIQYCCHVIQSCKTFNFFTERHVVAMYEHTLSPDEKSKLAIKPTVHYVLNQFSFVRNAPRRQHRQGTGGREVEEVEGRKLTVAGFTDRVFFSLGLPLKVQSTQKLILAWCILAGVSGTIYVNVNYLT